MTSIGKNRYSADGFVEEILSECRARLEKSHFSDDEISMYLDRVVSILDCYHEQFGDDLEFEYRVFKRFRRVELRLVVQGEKFNPLEKEKEEGDTGQSVERELGSLARNQIATVAHTYIAGRNIVTVVSPRGGSKAIHRSPMLWAAV